MRAQFSYISIDVRCCLGYLGVNEMPIVLQVWHRTSVVNQAQVDWAKKTFCLLDRKLNCSQLPVCCISKIFQQWESGLITHL